MPRRVAGKPAQRNGAAPVSETARPADAPQTSENVANGVSAWPADAVERWSLDRLTPYARNARTHSEEQIGQLVASIREWGWTNPVLVDETGQIIAGHGRVLAARKLGLTDAPVMVARGWSDGQKRAYVVADNKLALNAGWDDSLLKIELADLKISELQLTGFGAEDLASLFAPPPAEADTSSKLGDLVFRVVVDCRDEEHQAELLSRFEDEGLPCRPLMS